VRQVDDAVERRARSDRQLRGDDVRAVRAAQRGQRRVEVRAGPIELVDEKEMRHFAHLHEIHDRRGLGDPVGFSLDDDDPGVDGRERGLGLLEEIDEAGCVDEVEIDGAARRVREAAADRLQMLDRFGLAVGDRRPVANRSSPRNRAAVREQCFDQRRLTRMVRDHRRARQDVPTRRARCSAASRSSSSPAASRIC
jgi:hypothetical protein